MPDGGPSVCGDAAVLQEICIERHYLLNRAKGVVAMRTSRILVYLVAAQGLLPLSAQSQEDERTPPRYPVAVVEVERLTPGSGAFEVIRRPDSSPSDVILVTEHATPAVLSQAVWTVIVAHQAEPGVPAHYQRIKMADAGSQTARLRQFSWAEMVLNDLATAQVVKIQGIEGYHKAKIIFLPREGPPASR